MNYYKKNGSYLVSDLELELEKSTEEEYNSWKYKQDRIREIKSQLNEIDLKSARSIRAILAETATDADREFLAHLEAQAEELRKELQDLQES